MEVRTDVAGHRALSDFYHFCQRNPGSRVELDWTSINHMDANLSALLMAMIHKLKREYRIEFYLDHEHLRGPLSIFWRNGLAQYIYKTGKAPQDDRKSTVRVRAFKKDSVDGFVEYVEGDLLKHRGMEKIQFTDKEKVKASYYEIFNNYEIHSQSTYPLIACGQYFPARKELCFTLVDMGVGFLKNIAEHTKSTTNIGCGADAIAWAVKGGSTKLEAAGGTGLKNIMFYCMKSGGSLQIVSDGCFWCFDGSTKSITSHTLPVFAGATVHLIFRYTA